MLEDPAHRAIERGLLQRRIGERHGLESFGAEPEMQVTLHDPFHRGRARAIPVVNKALPRLHDGNRKGLVRRPFFDVQQAFGRAAPFRGRQRRTEHPGGRSVAFGFGAQQYPRPGWRPVGLLRGGRCRRFLRHGRSSRSGPRIEHALRCRPADLLGQAPFSVNNQIRGGGYLAQTVARRGMGGLPRRLRPDRDIKARQNPVWQKGKGEKAFRAARTRCGPPGDGVSRALGIGDVDHQHPPVMQMRFDRTIAGQIEPQRSRPFLPDRAQAGARDAIIGLREIEAGSRRCQRDAGGTLRRFEPPGDPARHVQDDAGKAFVFTRSHADRLRRTRAGKGGCEQENGAKTDHAASCFVAFSDSSSSEKLGRQCAGVFCRPTSMQIFVA
ncbi:MAG: hypothetical protein ACLFRU_02060 [Paracoccaceae bacterium]